MRRRHSLREHRQGRPAAMCSRSHLHRRASKSSAREPTPLRGRATPASPRATAANSKRVAKPRRGATAVTLTRSRRQGCWISWRRSKRSSKDGRLIAAGRRHAGRHQPPQGLLARHRKDEGRPAALLRADRAADAPRHRGSAAGDEAPAQRRHRQGVLSAPRAGTGAAGRPRRDAARTMTCRRGWSAAR